MKNLNSKTVLASLLFAGLSLVSCKDKNSEADSGDTTGAEASGSYDENQAPTGETDNQSMNPGADGSTGIANDSTSKGTGGSGSSGSGTGGSGTGTGSSGTGSGTTTHP